MPVERRPNDAGVFAARGSLAGQIVLREDFELTEREIDELLDEPLP